MGLKSRLPLHWLFSALTTKMQTLNTDGHKALHDGDRPLPNLHLIPFFLFILCSASRAFQSFPGLSKLCPTSEPWHMMFSTTQNIPFSSFSEQVLSSFKSQLKQYFLLAASTAAAAAKSLQSCPTLCDPIYGSPPGSSAQGIFQARGLEWGAIAFSMFIHQKFGNSSTEWVGHTYSKCSGVMICCLTIKQYLLSRPK